MKRYSVEELPGVYNQSLACVQDDGWWSASFRGPYPWQFVRDTAETINSGFLATYYDWRTEFLQNTVQNALRVILSTLDEEGNLPQEFGFRKDGYPFEVDQNGFGKHGHSADGTGLTMLALAGMYAIPGNDEFRDTTIRDFAALTNNVIKNIDCHYGLYGFTSHNDGSSYEGTWADGDKSIRNSEGKVPSHPIYYVRENFMYCQALDQAKEVLKGEYPELSGMAGEAMRYLRNMVNKRFPYQKADGQWALARALYETENRVETVMIDELVALGYLCDGTSVLSEENQEHIVPIAIHTLETLTHSQYGVLMTQEAGNLAWDNCGYHGPNSWWPHINTKAVQSLEEIRKFPSIARNKELNLYLHERALSLAKANAGMLIAIGSPVETQQIHADGKICPYSEVRPDGTVFTSARIQLWTLNSSWVYEYLKDNSTKLVNGPSREMLC